MKKQSGFTLIELMVVMAIIAILATAGLSAYTGYIKKARDATRIADIAAINTIVLSTLSSTGTPPQSTMAVYNAVVAANNGKMLYDPLADQTNGSSPKSVCMNAETSGFPFSSDKECYYTYRVCDAGQGYAIGTRLESRSNGSLYANDDITYGASHPSYYDSSILEIGSCKTRCDGNNNPVGCPAVTGYDYLPTKIISPGTSPLQVPSAET